MTKSIPQQQATVFREKWQIIVFRIVFIFLLLLSIPFDRSYYTSISSINFLKIGFGDLFTLTHHVPGIVHTSAWGWQSYEGWLLALIVAVITGAIWQLLDKERTDYRNLYYWARAALRYRLAFGIIAYGIVLLIPVQFPQPTISDLHSAYGDFLPWKIYYHTTAVAAAGYRQTIGAIEVIAGILLLFRRTVPIGAIAIIFILVNVVLVNFAYDIGEHLFSSYLLLIAIVLLAHDLPRFYQLLVKETKVLAERYEPLFSKKILLFRKGVRVGFAFFFLLLAALTFSSYTSSNWPYSSKPGLSNAAGLYNVASFTLNDSLHPYSLTDTDRWQDVVLEKWNVLSIRTNRRATLNFSDPYGKYRQPLSNEYEFAGNAARQFYTYDIKGNTIELVNRSDSSDKFRFSLLRPDTTTIELRGTNRRGDSLSVTLNKNDKTYLLFKGRRKPITVY